MGMTVTVVDLNFNFRLFSPGIKEITTSASAPNLRDWIEQQLKRLFITTDMVSSVTCQRMRMSLLLTKSLLLRMSALMRKSLLLNMKLFLRIHRNLNS